MDLITKQTKVLTYTSYDTNIIEMYKVSDKEWEKMKNCKTDEERWEIFNSNVDNNSIPFYEQEDEESWGEDEISWGIHHS